MICRLCLKDAKMQAIQIFGKRGLELNIVGVLAKHFWFEPRRDDPISTAICNSCWSIVSVFHKFYLNVEEEHRFFSERFSIISKRTNERISHASPSSTMVKNDLKCKSEVDDDEDLDLQIDENLNSASRDNTRTGEINNEAQKSKPSHENVCEGASSSRVDGTLTEEVHYIDFPKEGERMFKNGSKCKLEVDDDEELDLQIDDILNSSSRDNTPTPTGGINNQAPKSKRSHEGVCEVASSSRDLPKEDKLVSPMKHNQRAKRSSTVPKPTGEKNDEAQKTKPSNESVREVASSSRGNETSTEEDLPKEDKLLSPKKHNRRAKLSSTSDNKNKYCLRKHKRRHNDEGKEFVCNICGKVSPNRIALQSHQRDVHLSERTFECTICKKAFMKATGLQAHMSLHTGEVLHRCPHCPKTFNSNATMHSHRKKCH